jgi:hypothetical protein
MEKGARKEGCDNTPITFILIDITDSQAHSSSNNEYEYVKAH